MAYTPFGAQMPEQKTAWVKEALKTYRENNFWTKFMGEGDNNIVQLVTELKKTEKGDRAYIGLIADLQGNGIVGDNDINGRHESLESSWININADQHRNGVKSKGRVDDQRSVFSFRKEAKEKLAQWKAQTIDEFMFLAASGISLQFKNNGATRSTSGQDDPRQLEWAADITAPTSNRHLRFDGTSLQAGNTASITTGHVAKYGMLVDLKAEAKVRGIKPLRMQGRDYYCWVCDPRTMAQLKKDADFRDVLVNAGVRGDGNPLFTGADAVTMDGIIIHTNDRVFNTTGAASGSKWGSGGTVNGTRSLFLGAQALAFADLWGMHDWNEDTTDAGAKNEIVLSTYYGIRKPRYTSPRDSNTVQDFGVIALDLAL